MVSVVSPLTCVMSSIRTFVRIPGARFLLSNQPMCFIIKASNNYILNEREREILSFKITEFYRVKALFNIEGNKKLESELNHKYPLEGEAQEFLENCKNAQ